ncbi:MAG: Fic family protein [Gammaproteobacteria bacterium]|nr:Fic family protein [Gammaproteobacteria bacterium]
MRSLTSNFLDSLSFSSQQLETLTAIGVYQGKQALFDERLPDTLEAMRNIAKVESAESSNRIEGIEAPRKRIQSITLEHTIPRDRSEQEIAGYRDALELIHESSMEMAISPNVISQLHTMMYNYLPQPGGSWKQVDNEIVERKLDGTWSVRFKPVPAATTAQAMEDLSSGLERALYVEQRPGLLIAPLAILDFLCIHPFSDGNGRISRLLTLMLLYKLGHQVGRYISFERVVEQSKETYYEALGHSSAGWHQGRHDPHPWLNYFWGIMLKAYTEFSDRAGSLQRGAGGKSAQVRAVVGRMTRPSSVSDIQVECPGVSLPTIKRELQMMKDEGLVMLQGRGRGAKWSHVSGR